MIVIKDSDKKSIPFKLHNVSVARCLTYRQVEHYIANFDVGIVVVVVSNGVTDYDIENIEKLKKYEECSVVALSKRQLGISDIEKISEVGCRIIYPANNLAQYIEDETGINVTKEIEPLSHAEIIEISNTLGKAGLQGDGANMMLGTQEDTHYTEDADESDVADIVEVGYTDNEGQERSTISSTMYTRATSLPIESHKGTGTDDAVVKELKLKIDRLEESIDKLEIELASEISNKEKVTCQLAMVNEDLNKARRYMLSYQSLVEKMSLEIVSLWHRINNDSDKMKQSNELMRFNQLLQEENTRLMEIIDGNDNVNDSKINELTMALLGKSSEVDFLTSQLEIANIDKDSLISELKVMAEIAEGLKAKASEFEEAKVKLAALEGRSQSLSSTVESLKRTVAESNANLRYRILEVEKKDAQIKQLAASNAKNVVGRSTTKSLMNGAYTGRAKIINVYGIGSYGITSVTMNIAQKLSVKHSVLVMDADLVNPSCDAWLRCSPLVRELTGIEGGDSFKTGFGYIIKRDNYEHKDLDMLCIRGTNGWDVEYFSGMYNSFSDTRLMYIDLTEVINYLGSKYDYIIVDNGKIGCNVSFDSLIKTFSEIANNSIIVTKADQFSARSMSLKLMASGIDTSRAIWVLNMSETNKVPDSIMKYVSGVEYATQIPRVPNYNTCGINRNLLSSYSMCKKNIDEIVKIIS